jgi:hypothetical protein
MGVPPVAAGDEHIRPEGSDAIDGVHEGQRIGIAALGVRSAFPASARGNPPGSSHDSTDEGTHSDAIFSL